MRRILASEMRHISSKALSSYFCLSILLLSSITLLAGETAPFIDLGISSKDYKEGLVPEGWYLRKRSGVDARWVKGKGGTALRLTSKGALVFLEKEVDIDIKEFPVVTWRWRVENILKGNDERTMEGDDQPIRIFFAFAPPEQSFWIRLKRFVYLDRLHGHPFGGRFTEYLWSSHLKPGDVINDPENPMQKLFVIEGGASNIGRWLSYRRNLHEDFRILYGEEPRRLIFIGIINDTDQTGQEAVSYIADLKFHKSTDGD